MALPEGPIVVDAGVAVDAGIIIPSSAPSGLEVAPSAGDFGAVSPAMTASPRVFMVTNHGPGSIRIEGITIVGEKTSDFSIVGMTTTASLAAGQAFEVTVRFSPKLKSTSPEFATVQLTTSDPRQPVISRPLQGLCPTCPEIGDGCDAAHPYRLWPQAADVASCTDGGGATRTTTGAGSPEWTFYGGCASQLDFAVTPGKEVVVSTSGDGCACPGCQLWHIDYDLQENLGSSFATQLHVQVPDDVQCPNGKEDANTTLYSPKTSLLRMNAVQASTGEGFYFHLCSS